MKIDVCDFDKCVIRRTISEFHTTEGERPTLKSLLSGLKEKIKFSGGTWVVWKYLQI
jgi:hypothetical protein